MITIEKIIELAKNGNLEERKKVRQYYSYIIKYYHEKYKDKINVKDLTVMYDMILDEYYNTDQKIPLRLFIHKQFIDILYRKFDKKEKEYFVNELIVEACKGNLDARKTLIEHFMPIVYEEAKKHDYMEYDELIQNGMVKLIENIDNLINIHKNGEFATTSLRRAVKIYFSNTLRCEVDTWRNSINCTDDEVRYQMDYIETDNFKRLMYNMELENFIDNYPCTNEYKRIIREYLFDSIPYKTLGVENSISHESVRTHVIELGKKYQKIK